jgi:hypothetical protein
MADTYLYDGFEVKVDTDVVSPGLLWEARHTEWARKVASNKIYESMSEDERLVIIEKVRRCMEVMYDYAEEWVPDSFSMDEIGQVLKVELNLLVGDLEDDVIERYKATSIRRRNAMLELKRLVESDEADNS